MSERDWWVQTETGGVSRSPVEDSSSQGLSGPHSLIDQTHRSRPGRSSTTQQTGLWPLPDVEPENQEGEVGEPHGTSLAPLHVCVGVDPVGTGGHIP